HLAPAAVLAQAMERGQRVGRNVRAQPGDWIAVVVVVRGLDQHQLEGRFARGGAHERAFWSLRTAKPTNEKGKQRAACSARQRGRVQSRRRSLWNIALERTDTSL